MWSGRTVEAGPVVTDLPVSDDTLAAKHRLDQSRWWEQAKCAGAPFHLFDTPRGQAGKTRNALAIQAQAAAICATCPVITECRADADLLPDPSFRAGCTAAERARQNRAKR